MVAGIAAALGFGKSSDKSANVMQMTAQDGI
jgi:hypothetical protein